MLRFKYELMQQGVSQTAIAEQVGCRRESICRIANGREPAYPKRGRRIAEALGWPVERAAELFEEVEVRK